jgi:uncharacterized membrane protein
VGVALVSNFLLNTSFKQDVKSIVLQILIQMFLLFFNNTNCVNENWMTKTSVLREVINLVKNEVEIELFGEIGNNIGWLIFICFSTSKESQISN